MTSNNTSLSGKSVAISGSHGLVGAHLIPMLQAAGAQVVRLVRQRNSDDIYFNPQSEEIEAHKLEGVDIVIHLGGANISDKSWSSAVKKEIYDSRVQSTALLVSAFKSLKKPPQTFLCASAVGFYGDRQDETLNEQSGRGSGFLCDVVHDWEDATKPAQTLGIRTLQLRFGVILHHSSGALAKMLTPFKWGVGGRLGDGQQWMSWVALDDALSAIMHLISHEQAHGAFNITSPEPVRNRDFVKILAHTLHRPAFLPLPKTMIRLIFGEMGETLLLHSARVLPDKLMTQSNFTFQWAHLEEALKHLLASKSA